MDSQLSEVLRCNAETDVVRCICNGGADKGNDDTVGFNEEFGYSKLDCPQNWEHAQEACESVGAKLATPRDVAELLEFEAAINAYQSGGGTNGANAANANNVEAWLGLNDRAEHNVWTSQWGEAASHRHSNKS